MNHTLVIPTYNRPDLVRRLVGYYLKRSTEMQLLVLDSSKADIAAANGEWFSGRAPNVRYVIYPESTQPGAKLAQGLTLVQTPCVSFCADDDLVFPQGLADAIRFLGSSPDYVCAHGLYLNFQVHAGSKDVNIWREYGGPGNDAGHPGARIFRLLQSYESLFYAVFRTGDLRDVFDGVQAIPSLHYQELFQSVATLIKGKVKRLPVLYGARQSIAAAQPEREHWQTYYWFAGNAAEMLEHYRSYCELLWRFYESYGAAPRLERAAFQKVLDLSHAVYFSATCPPAYFHDVLQPWWPHDTFVKPGLTDMFSQLGDAESRSAVQVQREPGRDLCQTLSAARLSLLAALYTPHLRMLDWRARRLGGTAWKCRLPWNLLWLAGKPEFRRTYLDLCRYLDGR